MNLPDSPEGVAFGLVMLILGENDPTASQVKRDVQEVLRIYRECINAVTFGAPEVGPFIGWLPLH